jgi:hypothetical protein
MGETRIYCPVCKMEIGLRNSWIRHKKSKQHQDNLKINNVPINEVWKCPTHKWSMSYSTIHSHMYKYHKKQVNEERNIHEYNI